MATIEEALDGINGPRETYRPLLYPANILKRICRTAEGHALRRGTEPWVIIGNITGHGSGVSNAIYRVYSEEPVATKNAAVDTPANPVDPDEMIDVWEVEPHKDPEYDVYWTDDARYLHEYVGEIAEQLLDNLVQETVTITIRHREMKRRDFDRRNAPE